jgi:hypothetical protein
MVKTLHEANLLEMVWAIIRDGRWHSRRSISKRIPARKGDVGAALDFMAKYGFTDSSAGREEKYKLVADGPSPDEVAWLLCSLLSSSAPYLTLT